MTMNEEYENWIRETGEKMGWACVPRLLDGCGYDMGDCPDYGCSDCPATMGECKPCSYTEEELNEVLSYKWR